MFAPTRIKVLWVTLLLAVTVSCTKKIESKDFLKWLSKEENGLVKTKRSNGFAITLKYLPLDYFVSRELLNQDLKQVEFNAARFSDSIRKEHAENLYFMLHIDNDTSVVRGSADIMFRDIYDYGSYNSRIYKMNFDFADDIELVKNQKHYHPILTSFENHYGLDGGRNIMLVFSPQEDSLEFGNNSDLELTYNDEELGIGITHFNFSKSDIENIPQLVY